MIYATDYEWLDANEHREIGQLLGMVVAERVWTMFGMVNLRHEVPRLYWRAESGLWDYSEITTSQLDSRDLAIQGWTAGSRVFNTSWLVRWIRVNGVPR